jgi:hypothetical protein
MEKTKSYTVKTDQATADRQAKARRVVRRAGQWLQAAGLEPDPTTGVVIMALAEEIADLRVELEKANRESLIGTSEPTQT